MGVNFDYKRDEKKNRYDLGLLGTIIITAGSALYSLKIYLFIYLFI